MGAVPPRRTKAGPVEGSAPRRDRREQAANGLPPPAPLRAWAAGDAWALEGAPPEAASEAALPGQARAFAGREPEIGQPALRWLQRSAGNAVVARRLAGAALVQRHPVGARPAIDPETTAESIEGGGGGGAAAPAPAPPVGPGGGGGAAAPARALRNEAMTLATADAALTRSYGGVHRIVTVPVTILDHAGILRAYDDDCISRSVPFTDPATGTTRPWRRGDADPSIEGFALNDHSRIYVQRDTSLPTATAHELLHANTAADFRGAVGEAINEGTTEYLALKAVTAAGLPTTGPTGALAYPDQVTAVQQLVRVVGEDTLIQAYFGGAATLVAAYEALMPGTFAALRGAGTLDTAHMAALLVPRTAAEKVALVRSHLVATPTQADFAAIRAICNSDPADIPVIRAGVFADLNRVVTEQLDGAPGPATRDVITAVRALPCADREAISGILLLRIVPRLNSDSTMADLTYIQELCDRDPAGVPAARSTLAPAITSMANERLDGWVSDNDLNIIERLYKLPVADQAAIRAALDPRTTELISIGQRTRLRVILAS